MLCVHSSTSEIRCGQYIYTGWVLKFHPPWNFLITCLILQISKWNLQHLSPTYIGTILQHIIEIDNVLTKLLHFLYHCCKMQSDHARALWSHPLNNNLIFFSLALKRTGFIQSLPEDMFKMSTSAVTHVSSQRADCGRPLPTFLVAAEPVLLNRLQIDLTESIFHCFSGYALRILL
jgi:hypothetical protein